MYESLTDEQAIEYAKSSIGNLKGITRASWERVLALAESKLKMDETKIKSASDFSNVMDSFI